MSLNYRKCLRIGLLSLAGATLDSACQPKTAGGQQRNENVDRMVDMIARFVYKRSIVSQAHDSSTI